MRWGVVTSAVGEMTRIRIGAGRLLIPHVLVALAGVTRGKPRPEEYRIAADCLGVAVDEFVVFEDSATSIEVVLRGAEPSALRRQDIYHFPMPSSGSRIPTVLKLNLRQVGTSCC